MLAGLDAALLLLGLPAPVRADRLPEVHGMLMVLGFLGTVIALERAVALRAPWGSLAPALTGAGALALLTPAPLLLGQLLLVQGCALLALVYLALWQRATEGTVLVQLLGVLLAGCAAALWTVVDVAFLLPWLAGFLVLTIAAERAELARLAMPRGAAGQLLALAAVLVAATAASLLWPRTGTRLFGLALALLVAWLVRHDVATRLVRSTGLPRFSSAALLLGYGWLAVAATVWAVGGPPAGVAAYDTVIHATFLGFAVSMVMAHAPVILPAVLGVRLPYRPVLWVPLAVLHTGMVVRVAGHLLPAGAAPVWQAGSVLTVVAVLLLVLTAAFLVVTG